MARLGIISDTHGLLRPEAVEFLKGCDHIIHGGDVGPKDILTQLSAVAPVTTVRGNTDKDDWANALPETELLEFGGMSIYVVHDLAQLDIDPAAAGVRIVVSGHSHKPLIEERRGVIYLNPGSAGPRRFKLPVAVAEVVIDGDSVIPRVVELQCGSNR